MKPVLFLAAFFIGAPAFAQTTPSTSAAAAASAPETPAASPAPTTGTGIINPRFNTSRPRAEYPVPYGPPKVEEVTQVLVRVRDYLAANTPARFVHRTTGAEMTEVPSPDAALERGAFNVIGYEWGVVYSGMLNAAEATGDAKFRDYVDQRMKFIAEYAPKFRSLPAASAPGAQAPRPGDRFTGAGIFRAINSPRTLDDSGSMGAAMIKAHRAGVGGELRPLIDNLLSWIHTKQERLDDGTLSRSRPLPHSLWLDDLYMSVPALAQMGKLTGEQRYFDDAVKQITQFAGRMFNREKGLWMHGWVQSMETHPEFRWGRANGWAVVAMAELLDVLPENHPGRPAVLDLYRAHVRGLANTQGRDGRWHQLLDRPDSYLETSITAMVAYAVARGINRGWLDPLAHAPMAILAWNAVTTQVNAQGQIENVCVGTGMGFDPAFYYARPVSPLAPHGPGPVLLAGAEMITLAKTGKAIVNDEAMMFGRPTGM
ncbi:MAG TPA: glycoside hydrolase family 88 protein [Opitutaceae bacterium]|nr:glycoside hydrolase family 88 protein [Opitutaceae bacterium]